jgi:integrase
LRKRGKETVRDRHLSAEELRRFWVALDGLPNHIADALKLLALTGQRRSEVGGMALHELDLGETPIWTLPEERVKNKLIHTVPLTPAAVEIVTRNIPLANGPFLFPARLVQPKPIEGSTLSARFCDLMRKLDIEGVRLHDLRHTVKTGLARLGVPDNISDRVTNQVTGQRARVGSRYDHHTYLDEKRRALELWERRLLEIVEGSAPSGERW